MNRKRIICTLLILSCVSVLLSSCGKDDEKTTSSEAKTVSSYIESIKNDSNSSDDGVSSEAEEKLSPRDLLFKYLEDELSKKHKKLGDDIISPDDNNTKGLVGAQILDLDGDDCEEMITSRCLGKKNTELCVEIYSVKEDKVSLAGTVVNGKDTFSNAYANFDVFLTEKDGKKYICTKFYHSSEASGVPNEQSMKVYEYNSGKIKQVCNIECSEGSYNYHEISLNGEIVFVSSSGSVNSNYKYKSFSELADNLSKVLKKFGVYDKIYEEKSGESTIALTLEGYSKGNDIARVGYRREVISGSLTTLQVQFTTSFCEE